jgi:curved DNA-binding protein CbpA
LARDSTDSLTCPWDILGVSPWDDAATIRSAWRALVRQYHPDLARTDREGANRRLAEINHAFDVVSDPVATQRKIDALRRAETASRSKAAKAARTAAPEHKAQRPVRDRRSPAETPRSKPESPRHAYTLDRRWAQTARERFDLARRILEDGPNWQGRAIYM